MKQCVICKDWYEDSIADEPHICNRQTIIDEVKKKYAHLDYVEDEDDEDDDW